jgi:Pentapeptide repeats (8 copies)
MNVYSQTRTILEQFDNQHDFERMSAAILIALGNDKVVPIAPKGGGDDGKDIEYVTIAGVKGLACVTLQAQDAIEKKFTRDFSKRQAGEYGEYLFFCKAYLTAHQKFSFTKYCVDELQATFTPYDLEALTLLLDNDIRLREIRDTYLYGNSGGVTPADSQKDGLLYSYIDKMSELLLKEGLRDSKSGAPARSIARSLTLATLRTLDASRKGHLFLFLWESGLINVINLSEADLSGADISGANLTEAQLIRTNFSRANLNGVVLTKATLIRANLRDTTLIGATLWGADLRDADLSGADLENAALSGVNLNGATYTEEQLSKARWNDNIIR